MHNTVIRLRSLIVVLSACWSTVAVASPTVRFSNFYDQYRGHSITMLRQIHNILRQSGEPLVFLAGDSSLDNKHWIRSTRVQPIPPYDQVPGLTEMVPDIAFHLTNSSQVTAINTAIEASLLSDRLSWYFPFLPAQDQFIHDNLQAQDVLVVSVGGNDIALNPSITTMVNLAMLVRCLATEEGQEPHECSGFSHFVDLFKTGVESYIAKLVAQTKPRKVVVCMIYFPDMHGHGWADASLNQLMYSSRPELLQSIIRDLFEHATRRITVPGVDVVPLALFETLDGTNSAHYVSRVEPSVEGGRRMAQAIIAAINSTTYTSPDADSPRIAKTSFAISWVVVVLILVSSLMALALWTCRRRAGSKETKQI